MEKIKIRKHNKAFPSENGFKKCNCCLNIYPANTDYYHSNKNTVDGLNNRCKECCGYKFTDRLTKIPKEGHIFCKKCGRELPHTYQYFPEDKNCKTGLRNVCRECSSSYGRFLNDGEKPHKSSWTEEEIQILIDNYKDYTNLELQQKFFPDKKLKSIQDMAYSRGVTGTKTAKSIRRSRDHANVLISEKLTGYVRSKEFCEKVSISRKKYYETHESWFKGKPKSKEQCKVISENAKKRGAWLGDKNPRHINPLNGELNGRWKGGINAIYTELRSDTKDWFKESIDYFDYKCVITGKNFDNVHHSTPFRDIVNEVFECTGIEIKPKVCDYDESELNSLRNKLKELHNYYGYGAPINKDVHKLFHDTYGYCGCTPDNFFDFIQDIQSGKHDNWFAENKLEININEKYVNYLSSALEKLNKSA